MDIIQKKLTDLHPYEKNPRLNDDAVEFVANSIKQFGFKVPIIIDKDNTIVAGHTRYKACEQLGIEEVPCILADDLTPEQVKAFRIAENKTGEKATWDTDLLGEELKGLLDDFKMTDFGFGEFEISILTEDFEPEPYDDEVISQYEGNDEKFTANKRCIITYKPEEEAQLRQLLKIGAEDELKVIYRLTELL